MAELKTKANDGDVTSYLSNIADDQMKKDCMELLKIISVITKEQPRMWGTTIVGFGSYHYKYKSGQEGDWFLTGFSPRKQNLTIYITAGFKEFEDILQDFGKHKLGSSCLYIKSLADIDKKKLKLLIKKSVAYMKNRYI